MRVHLHNPHDRYRRRSIRRTLHVCFFTLSILFFIGTGYWFGGLSAQQEIFMLNQERDAAQRQYEEFQGEITQLRAEAQTAEIRLAQVRAGIEEILPEGPMQNLVSLLRKQIDEGVDPKRLESIILSARPPQNCSAPISRAFVISTPAYNGPESQVSLQSGLITISGEGQSVVPEQDKQEAWFDPSKPIILSFKSSAGIIEKKEGVLPIHHSMIIGDKEYRFTVTQGEKSFAKVTYDYCDYP